jgi:hypothetical protein
VTEPREHHVARSTARRFCIIVEVHKVWVLRDGLLTGRSDAGFNSFRRAYEGCPRGASRTASRLASPLATTAVAVRLERLAAGVGHEKREPCHAW